MTPQERFTLIQQAMQAFNPHYRENIQQVFTENGMTGADWFFSYLAYGLTPEPLTAELFHQTNPYANRNNQAERLAKAAEHGFLEAVAEDTYQLTEAGRLGVESFFAKAGQAISPLTPLVPEQMARLADLLARIITTTENANEPENKTNFLISRRTDPGLEAAAASRIDQYLTDLLRYRDDAHLAAWANLDVDGRTWEAFTFVWNGQANSPAELSEALSNRNFSEADYATSLAELARRGWVQKVDTSYQMTENGRKLREQADEETDKHFLVGWSALTDEETAECDTLLVQIRDRLQEMAADMATAVHNEAGSMAGEISGSLFKLTRSVVNPLLEEIGLVERGLGFMLIQAGYFDPEPVSAKRINRRTPYAAPANWEALLQKLVDRGLLSTAGDGDYLLTEDGRFTLNRVLSTFHTQLATIEVDVDLARLAELLGRIVSACLSASDPPGTWSIQHSHNLAPGDDAAPLAQIDQFLDDLNAFRDDAHLAAFAPHEISGHGWELFTQLWRGEVETAADMAEKMHFRGHDEAAYAAALDDLAARGWVELDGALATVTKKGKDIRQTAETDTDRYYYRPWLALNQAEAAELRELMTALNGRLAELAERATVPN